MRIAIGLVMAVCAFGENWPQFRGAGGGGVSAETGLPTEWGAQKNILWKTAIPGAGHSSPVVWGKTIFLTTAMEGEAIAGAAAPVHKIEGQVFRHPDATGAEKSWKLAVLAVDADSGKILWQQTAYEGRVYDDRHKKNTYASPTPVTDGKRVYVSFESQGVYAYEFDGKLAWKAQVGSIGTLGMSAGTSPVLFEDIVILQCDQEDGEGSFIAGLSARDGKQVWKTVRKEPVGWSTPVLAKAGGQTLLVASGMKTVIAYDPKTGKEVWKSEGVEGNAVPSPVSGLGMVFPSAGYPTKRVYGMRLTGEGERIAWRYDKGTAYVPSPILYGDYLYLVTDAGLMTCVEARTGAVKYEGKRMPKAGRFSSSPVAYGGKLFLTSEDGDTYVMEAGAEFQVVGTNALEEPVYTTPALSNGRVYVRGARTLYAIGN